MIPTVWEIIFRYLSMVNALILLTTIIVRWVRIKPVVWQWHIAGVYTYVALRCIIKISDFIREIACGSILRMFFAVVSIAVVVICVVNEGLERRVKDLAVAVAKLHGMQTALRRLDQLPFSKQCNRCWLKSVDSLQRTEKVIKVRYDGCGVNYLKRFAISWKVDEMLNTANGLFRQGDKLLHPQDHLQGSTKFYKKVVIDFIKDMADDSGLLGIWGMGSVGKTSLLKLLLGDSRSEYEYDNDSFEVLFVRAGSGCTVGQVQEVIATSMGLSLERNGTSQAKIIHDRLKDKSFLLLLDDLWGYVDLKAVGIPSPLGTVRANPRQIRRKVVLTSRNMDMCDNMGCRRGNTIQMQCLKEEDVWDLYYNGSSEAISSVIDKSPEVLLVENSSCSSHTRGQLAISQLLGVWGMRGVGKTALLRLIRDSYTSSSCFDHIIFAGAGTGSVVKDVQHAIAINLGLDMAMMSSLDELSRAMHISNYLEDKSFLLFLDDIREPLNWWAIGMPILSSRHQRIILATRSQAACALMGCHQIIEMPCLGGDAAWKLFRDKAGLRLIDDHPQVHHLAKQMVTRCGGLPLALCSLGRAMSNKRDPREWRSAYSQLTAMRLEPCEIDERVGAIILNPQYGWRKDTTPLAE